MSCSSVTSRCESRGGFNLNTFLRWNHYDEVRGVQLRYDSDRPHAKWRIVGGSPPPCQIHPVDAPGCHREGRGEVHVM